MIDRSTLSKLALEFRDLNIGDFFTTTSHATYKAENSDVEQMQVWVKKDHICASVIRIQDNTVREKNLKVPFMQNEKVIPLFL